MNEVGELVLADGTVIGNRRHARFYKKMKNLIIHDSEEGDVESSREEDLTKSKLALYHKLVTSVPGIRKQSLNVGQINAETGALMIRDSSMDEFLDRLIPRLQHMQTMDRKAEAGEREITNFYRYNLNLRAHFRYQTPK